MNKINLIKNLRAWIIILNETNGSIEKFKDY